jgi:hypothetical protein
MQEGPVNLASPTNPDAVLKPELSKPAAFHPVPQMMIMPSPERMEAKSQLVKVKNTDQVQTHIIIDRYYNGIELKPGQVAEIDMLVDDIAAFRKLALPERGFYTSGHLVGKPLPQHPIRILDIPSALHPQHQSFDDDEAIRRANEAAAAAAAAAAQAAQAEKEAESRNSRRR